LKSEEKMNDTDTTIAALKELLHYDAEDGVFTWKVRPWSKSKCRAGDVAGRVITNQSGQHWYISSGNRSYNASMLAWAFTHGTLPDRRLKFLDGNSLNFRMANLKLDPTYRRKRNGGALPKLNITPPDKMLKNRLRYLYGMTVETFEGMLAAQNGCCAICERPERAKINGKVKPLSVDHDHVTGAPRQLLCSHCNHTLGHMEDNPTLLEKAAAYLRKHQRISETPHEGNVIQLRKPA
jgi:hypothetical protein